MGQSRHRLKNLYLCLAVLCAMLYTIHATRYTKCGECPPNCNDKDGVSHCWGKGPTMCQRVDDVKCDTFCKGKCFKEGILGCCHPQCAAGCRNGLDTQCEMCKYFRHGLKCVERCPDGTYPIAQECIDF